jgi:hypothetical protein
MNVSVGITPVSYTYHNLNVGLQDDSILSYLVWDDGSDVQSFYGAKIIRFRQPHTQFPTLATTKRKT